MQKFGRSPQIADAHRPADKHRAPCHWRASAGREVRSLRLRDRGVWRSCFKFYRLRGEAYFSPSEIFVNDRSHRAKQDRILLTVKRLSTAGLWRPCCPILTKLWKS